MIKDFFDINFSLLGNSQTFVATIATLIILCSFRDNSANFIAELIKNFTDILFDDIKRIISQLSADSANLFSFLDDWNVYYRYDATSIEQKQALLKIKMEAELLKYQFYIDDEKRIKVEDKSKEEFEEKQKPLNNKPSLRLIAFFVFILCVAILTFDSLNLNQLLSSFLLFTIDFLSCIITVSVWGDYLITKKTNKPQWFNIVFLFLDVILCLLLLFSSCMVLVLIATVLLLLVLSIALYFRIISKVRDNNYNIRAITKYSFYCILLSLAISLIMYLSVRYSLLYDIAPENIQYIFSIATNRLLTISEYLYVWRSLFVVLCVSNAFILPLFLTYLTNKKNSKIIKKVRVQDRDNAIKKLNHIKQEYNDLKEEIKKV